jgi:hypothetical protein
MSWPRGPDPSLLEAMRRCSAQRPRLTRAPRFRYRLDVVKVVEHGRYRVYVYAEVGQPHHQPHCHVRWPDGECSVELLLLTVLAGDELPAAARRLLRDHLPEIRRVWTALNPGERFS